MKVTIHEAKTNLSKLIQKALNGDEVIIAKGKKPVVRLVAIKEVREQRRVGGLKNLIHHISDDFDAPLDEFNEYMK